MRMTLAAVIAAAVAAVGLPASASAEPPVDAPPDSTCTFAKGITTCVEALGGTGSVLIEHVEDPTCLSGIRENRTELTSIDRRITVFRGRHQLGEPRTETETSTRMTTACLPPA
jgi:hypothetical protein